MCAWAWVRVSIEDMAVVVWDQMSLNYRIIICEGVKASSSNYGGTHI